MRDEAENARSPFFEVTEGMAQLASDPDLIFLYERGKMQGRMSDLVAVLDELAAIRQRVQQGEALEGDAFRAMRLLLRFPKREVIRTLLELGLPNDEDAILPWRADLKRRKPSNHDRLTAQIRDKVDHRFNQHRKQDAIVRRVMLVRMNSEVSLPEALKIVAKGDDRGDAGLLGEYSKPVAQSVATVRSYYMAGMRRRKAFGYVEYKANALIGGGYRKLYFGDLIKKGRRPRK